MQSDRALDETPVPACLSGMPTPGDNRFRATALDAGLIFGIGTVLIICVCLLADAHRRTQQAAEQNELNVVEALASRIGHDLDSLSRSVEGAARNLRLPGIWDISPELRQAALFDAATQVKSLSSVLIIARDGRVETMYGTRTPPAIDLSDREFFEFHRTHPDSGVHVSGPIVSRVAIGATKMILSKRVNDRDGNFAGVVSGSLYIEYYRNLFHQFNLGSGAALALVTTDGHYIARVPEDPRTETFDLSQQPLLIHAARADSGTFVSNTRLDDQMRLIAYRKVDGFPFIVALGRDTVDVFAEWRRLVTYIGAGLLTLSGFELLLIWEFRRERLRRTAAEQYARLSARALATVNKNLEGRIREEIKSREDALEKLAASQRLEALGQLAGGIAHDINNVLQTISGACSLLQLRIKDNDDIQRLTKVALSAADRGSAITRRLLVFARRAVIAPEQVDITAILTDLQDLLIHTLCGSVMVELNLDQNLPCVLVDRMQLETVIINLATNARDAMPDGGTITISANVEIVAVRNGGLLNLAPERFVCLSVADTGCGMDEQILARAMEPFFSTKGVGQGTGLGLPMAKGFVEQSKGKLDITSRLGEGTTVTLWFPAAETGRVLGRAPLPVTTPEKEPGPQGSCVLVVDDNRNTRELVSEWLATSGFVVHQADAGDTALAMITTGLEVDLLLTDLWMPKMDGVQLIRAVRQIIPELPAIILTGNTGAVASLAIEDEVGGKCLVLRKPIRVSELADHIELALSGAYTSSAVALFGLGSVVMAT